MGSCEKRSHGHTPRSSVSVANRKSGPGTAGGPHSSASHIGVLEVMSDLLLGVALDRAGGKLATAEVYFGWNLT